MNDIEKLENEATVNQLINSENTTYADGDQEFKPSENNVTEELEQSEGDVVPDTNPKEEWADDVQQNQDTVESQIPSEIGSGAYSSIVDAWSNNGSLDVNL